MTLNGHLDATVDHEIIEGWWGRHPTANVGIACGASRRVVLDVDPRHHGDDELAVLLAEEGQTLPETWTVGTSRGGSHVHLGWPAEIPNDPPPRFVRNLCPGVEVKAAGGYVVAPPSLHVTGDRYQFLIGAGPSDLRTPAMCPAWLWTRITREAAACDGTPSGPVACSLLGVLFEQHRLVRATLAPEKWAVTCPWEAAHTAGRALSGTVLFGPREPGGLGGFFCAHAHCADRDARAVLTWCSSGEIEAARRTLHARLTAAQGNGAEQPSGRAAPGGSPHTTGRDGRATPWDRFTTAAALCAEQDVELDWLEPRLLAPGSITEWFSPRGLGKTLLALALAVKHARGGHRVLLLDRDNSRREVRRRLRAWGAADLTTLLVKTRDEVPPLTDGAPWGTFPFGDYNKLVIIDSLDASMEGVGEQDSAKPSKAIAPLLDIAHRPNGPAMLVLGNTIKSGTHGRGSGVVEDRADISYEVRDATDLRPTGTKPWWTELPAAGRDAWAERATRRKGRDCIRLAFTQGKFRVGKEPARSSTRSI
jgi:Bifunctional DNA primase/polymerase, N-terminal/AAA domain